MSLVGPRPERPSFVDQLKETIPFYELRHSVKPGITGWAQVRYHYGGSIEDARLQVQAAKDRFPKDGYTLFHLACVHALFGEADEALRLLHSAQSRGYYVRSELHSNGDLDLLRGNPAFEKL